MKDNIKEDMEYTTEEIEEINSLIEEIDMLCKDDSISPLREDQMCEFLLLKDAVSEGISENEFLDSIEDILEYEKAKGGYDVRKMQVQRKLALRAKKRSSTQPKPAKSKVPSRGLSPAQRRKMAIRMRIQAKKPGFIKKRLRALKRAATKAVIAQRSRKAAIKMVVKKFFPKLRTKKKSELSMSDRAKISDIVKAKSKIITRFAKKLLIKTRKQDVERRRAMSGKKDKAGVKGES